MIVYEMAVNIDAKRIYPDFDHFEPESVVHLGRLICRYDKDARLGFIVFSALISGEEIEEEINACVLEYFKSPVVVYDQDGVDKFEFVKYAVDYCSGLDLSDLECKWSELNSSK